MYKSASETTLKTSSTPIGNDNTEFRRQCARDDAEIRDAVAQALRWLEQGHDFTIETVDLFDLDLDTNAGIFQLDLLALEKAHHLTGHGNNDVEWAYGVLAATRTEEAATPAVRIFLRTLPSGTTAWKIPEQIHTDDLLPYHASLAKRVAIRDARLTLYDRWDAEEKAAQAAAAQRVKVEAFSAACLAKMREENEAALAAWRATPEQQQRQRELESLRLPEEPGEADAAQKEAQETFMAVTGRPGMAEAAGWQANDAVSRHGLSAAEAVQQAVKSLSMWTWATPEARAKKAQEEHDPVLERLIAESRAIREAPLSAFAAEAGLGEDGEEIETPPVAQQHNPILDRLKTLQAETRAIREAQGGEDGYEGEPIPWDR
jgi:hypothetical protein